MQKKLSNVHKYFSKSNKNSCLINFKYLKFRKISKIKERKIILNFSISSLHDCVKSFLAHIITARQRSCGKVMYSLVPVCS